MNCPLCHQTLLERQEKYKKYPTYYCPRQISIFEGSRLSHYQLDSQGRTNTGDHEEIIFVLPYRIIRINNDYHLAERGECTEWFCQWKNIVRIPKFLILSEEHLRNKIKTLITFS